MTEISQPDAKKPRLVGINHIALEVGNIEEALDFYGKIFNFTLRGKRPGNAFIELGDQFINPVRRNQTAVEHAIQMTVSLAHAKEADNTDDAHDRRQ